MVAEFRCHGVFLTVFHDSHKALEHLIEKEGPNATFTHLLSNAGIHHILYYLLYHLNKMRDC
jgi:hypothetical protein